MFSAIWDFLQQAWNFLQDEKHLKALGFAVTVIGGLFAAGWAVYKHRSARKSEKSEPSVKIGLDEEKAARLFADTQRPFTDELKEELKKVSKQIAHDKGIPAAPLQAVLEKLGEKGVPDYEIPAKLNAAADQLIELRAQLARATNERPELAVIREAALKLIDQGEFDAARAKLNQGRDAARASREEASRKEAEFLADEARIDHLQLAYRAAAQKYATAATLVAPFDREAEWAFLMAQAKELKDLGEEFGDNAALAEAIELYRKALALVPRETSPEQWAATQNNLGTALWALGERESGTARLEEAVTAYREALKEYTRERVPLDWAMTQNNLGAALQALGEREGGTVRLEEAVAAYHEALKERTRERVPLQWATTQNNLGNALARLGERESGTARLKEAVAAFREALKEFTRERAPLQWAATQNNLGHALATLGERESGRARLEEAVAAYHEALKERTRERVPLGWAMTQNNLGTALRILGERDSGTVWLEEAVAACREALKEFTQERAPYYHGVAQRNLDRALKLLEARKRG
jgi:tetratricopeptide (TPR) repeat protein